jgi:hypothetical protein
MKLFNSLLGVFGMRHPLGLHDLDLLHEPSAIETPAIASADASTPLQPASAGVDGPPVQSGEASTGGHPNVDWDVIREGMASLRTTLVDAVAWLDEIDPNAAGLTKTTVRYDTTVNSHSAVDELAARRQQTGPYWPL